MRFFSLHMAYIIYLWLYYQKWWEIPIISEAFTQIEIHYVEMV